MRREKKRVSFLRKLHSVSSTKGNAIGTSKQKRKKRKGPSATLATFAASLAAELPSEEARGSSLKLFGTSVNNMKARERIAKEETARMLQVCDHPQFQSDPLAALTSHLSATLPPPPVASTADDRNIHRRKMDKKTRKAQRAASEALAAASHGMVE